MQFIEKPKGQIIGSGNYVFREYGTAPSSNITVNITIDKPFSYRYNSINYNWSYITPCVQIGAETFMGERGSARTVPENKTYYTRVYEKDYLSLCSINIYDVYTVDRDNYGIGFRLAVNGETKQTYIPIYKTSSGQYESYNWYNVQGYIPDNASEININLNLIQGTYYSMYNAIITTA